MTTLILAIIGLLLATAAGVAGMVRRLLRPARCRAADMAARAALVTVARAARIAWAFSQHAASKGLFAVVARIWAMPRQRLAEPD